MKCRERGTNGSCHFKTKTLTTSGPLHFGVVRYHMIHVLVTAEVEYIHGCEVKLNEGSRSSKASKHVKGTNRKHFSFSPYRPSLRTHFLSVLL